MNYPLVFIGVSLVILSVIFVLIGSFYKKKTTSNSSTRKTFWGSNQFAIIATRLKYDSEVSGKISVSEGEISLSLEDYFGWIPQAPIQWVGEKYFGWVGNGENSFNRNLSAGDYMFMFVSKSEKAEFRFDYTVVYHIPLLKRLIEVGLVLMEASIPLLVTGLVIS